MIHDRRKKTDINQLTNKKYFVRGSTELLDAIGVNIDSYREGRSIKTKTQNIANYKKDRK